MSLPGGWILILSSENVDQLWEIGISSELSILDRWDVYSDLKDTALVWHLWQGRKKQNVWWVRSTSLNRVMIVWWKWWWKWLKTYYIMTSSIHTYYYGSLICWKRPPNLGLVYNYKWMHQLFAPYDIWTAESGQVDNWLHMCLWSWILPKKMEIVVNSIWIHNQCKVVTWVKRQS